MNSLRGYLLAVVAAAIICAVVKRIFTEKNGVSAAVQLISGILLTVTVVRPVLTLDLRSAWSGFAVTSAEAQQVVLTGEEQACAALHAFIKERAEAYILNEASRWEAEISVQIRLSNDDIPQPIGITVSGTVSPYVKARLSQIIDEELGIPKEAQQWTG